MNARHRHRILCNVCNTKEASKYCFDCGATMCERCLTSVTIPVYVCAVCGEKYSAENDEACPRCGSNARNIENVITKLKCAVCGSENIDDLDTLFSKYPSTVMKILHTLREPFGNLTKIGTSITTHAVRLETIRENGINSCGVIEERLKEIREELLASVIKFDKLVKNLRKNVLFSLDQLKYFHNLTLDKLSVAEGQVKLIRENIDRVISKINVDIERLRQKLASLDPFINFVVQQNQLYQSLPTEIQTRLPTEPMAAIIGPVKGKATNGKRTIGKQFYIVFTFNSIHVISLKGEILVFEFFKEVRVRKEKSIIGSENLIIEGNTFTIKIKTGYYDLNKLYEEINFILNGEASKYSPVTESKSLAQNPVEISQPLMAVSTTLDNLFRYVERKLYDSYQMGSFYGVNPGFSSRDSFEGAQSPHPAYGHGSRMSYNNPFPTSDKIERINSELYSINESIETLKATIKQQSNPGDEILAKLRALYKKRYQLIQLLKKFGYYRQNMDYFNRRIGSDVPEVWDEYNDPYYPNKKWDSNQDKSHDKYSGYYS